jgi:hypothetical protein
MTRELGVEGEGGLEGEGGGALYVVCGAGLRGCREKDGLGALGLF